MKIPLHPDDLTAEWLTEALASTNALTQGRVISCAVQPLVTAKGMTASMMRVHLTYEPDNVEAPRSLIAKFSAPDPEARALIHSMGFYEREVRFYQELVSQSRVRTPRCYFSTLDPADGSALLLLEDLATARNGSWITGCSVTEAELVLRTIATLHAVWWQHPQLEQQHWLELRSLVSIQQSPIIFQQAWEPFLAQYDAPVSDEILQTGAWLKQYMDRLCVYLYKDPPYTLIHNDYQADNVFFAGTGPTQELIVIDWQLATRGRAALDVATFVAGHLEPSDRRDQELRLLRIYHTLLVDNGVRDYSFEQCWDDYRLAVLLPIARIITVIGIGAATEAQARESCAVIVPRYCRAAQDLKVGELLNATFAHHL